MNDERQCEAVMSQCDKCKPRTITTLEELVALPEHSVIVPFSGIPWLRKPLGWDNGTYRWGSESIASNGGLPAVVLWEPTQ